MKELFLLVKKNIVLMLRSKASALIIIFAPLLLVLLIGLSYDNFAGYGLTVGFVADSVGEDITALQTSLESQDFSVVQYTNLENCLSDIEQNYVHACLELPLDFSVQDNNAKSVTFHLDQSRINVVWIIQEVLRNEFSLKTQEVSEELVSNIFTKITSAQSNLDSQRSTLDNIKSAQGVAVSSLSEVDISVTDEDIETQDHLIETYENFILSSVLTAEDKINDLQEQIDGSDNISSGESDDLTLLVTGIQELIDDIELYTGGTGTFSFGEIQVAIDALQISVSSANSGVSGANTNLVTAQTDLETVVTALNSLSTELNSFEVDDSSTISAPLVTNIELVSSEKSKFNYLFPSLMVLVVMFISIMLGNTLVMMEKKSPAYIRNVLLPVSKMKFILANFFSVITLVAFQILILMGVSLLFVPADLTAFFVTFLTLLFVTAVFGFIGMILGSIFNSEETSILASISTGSLFLFLSGVILPIEGMSAGLRDLTALNPFVVAEEVVRRVFIFGGSFQGLFEPLMTLFLYSIILFLIILVFDSFIHQHLIEKYLYKKHKTARRNNKKDSGKNGTKNLLAAIGSVGSDELGMDHPKKSSNHSATGTANLKKQHQKKMKRFSLFSKRKKKEEFEL